MSTRAFRRLSRAERRGFISTIEDPLTRRAFEIVFLGPGKVSWRKAAERRRERRSSAGGKVSRPIHKNPPRRPAAAAVRKS